MSKELEKVAIDYGKKNGRNIYSYYNTELDLENAYRDGATSEAAKEYWQVQGLRWVKASERLPDKYYDYPKGIIFRNAETSFTVTIKTFAKYDYYSGDNWEWLEELSTPPSSDKVKEK